MSLQASAEELWQHGMTQMPIDRLLVREAHDAYKIFLAERIRRQDGKLWQQQRAGEAEPDRGFITRLPEEGKDIKSIFHYDTGIIPPVGYEEDEVAQRFLRAQYELLAQVNQQVVALLHHLQPRLSSRANWAELFARGQHLPYSTTTLRSLWYPHVPEQTGAQEHIDRSFITVHMGDEGGRLEALDGKGQPGSACNVSPPLGRALVFFGVKAMWVTEGKHEPLWHRSVTDPGTDRFALVQFCHVPLPDGYQVRDANEALDHFSSGSRIVR